MRDRDCDAFVSSLALRGGLFACNLLRVVIPSFTHAGDNMRICTLLIRSVQMIAIGLLLGQVAGAQDRTAKSTAKDPVEAANLEFSLSEAELDALKGQTFDLLYKNGKKETGGTLQEFLRSKQLRDRFRSIEFVLAGQKKARKIPSDQVFQLEQADTVYLVAYLPTQKYHVLVNVAKRDTAISARLAEARHSIWQPIPAEDQVKFVAEEKEFLDKVKAHFSQLPLQMVETQYFLFLSDMPAAQLNPYLKQLDQMNESLGTAFGFQPGHNIWRGKAVVIAFIAEESFVEYERVFMEKAADTTTVQGLCHSFPNGRVVVSAYRGQSPEHFGALLVHETAHGYMHRYKSTVHILSWFNEGIADWISGVAVPSCRTTSDRQRLAVDKLKIDGTLGGTFFTTPQIEPWHYGVASAMVQLLLQKSPDQFRLFFNGIKEGLTWEDSLMRAYGITPQELVTAYGQAIGVPNLRP